MTEPRIPLARPWLDDAESEALKTVLESGVLSRGRALERFEQGMAELTGSRWGVGVNSGTSGLQIALEALGIGPGDEVITPAFTFVGSVNAIERCGARAVLVDVDPDTLNMDPAAVAEAIGARTRALLVVHLFGRPADMDGLLDLAHRHDLRVVEDACEAIGARHRERVVGGLGDAGVFGFYPNKPVATGEGGMIVGRDPEVLTRCRQLRNQGVDPASGTRHDTLPGLSARLSELHAALGRVQLERLDESLRRRAAVADHYRRRLAGEAGVRLPLPARPHESMAWFTYPLRLVEGGRAERDRLIAELSARGIECGVYFEPVHRLPFHSGRHDGRPLPASESAGERSIALPLYPQLDGASIDRVCDALISLL